MVTERQHCVVLQYTTIPLLVPGYFHAHEDLLVRKVLLLLGICTGIASWLHWGSRRSVPLYHNADIALSTTYMVAETFTRPDGLLLGVAYQCSAIACYAAACELPVGTVEGLIAHLMFRHTACINVLSLYLDPAGLICWSVLHVCTVWAILDPSGFFDFIATVGGGRHKENIQRLYNC